MGSDFEVFAIFLPWPFQSGIFYFTIFNDYSASFSLILMLLLEIVLVIYVYGNSWFTVTTFPSFLLLLYFPILSQRRSKLFGGPSAHVRHKSAFARQNLWAHRLLHSLRLDVFGPVPNFGKWAITPPPRQINTTN